MRSPPTPRAQAEQGVYGQDGRGVNRFRSGLEHDIEAARVARGGMGQLTPASLVIRYRGDITSSIVVCASAKATSLRP
jgi:hypothetical protein